MITDERRKAASRAMLLVGLGELPLLCIALLPLLGVTAGWSRPWLLALNLFLQSRAIVKLTRLEGSPAAFRGALSLLAARACCWLLTGLQVELYGFVPVLSVFCQAGTVLCICHGAAALLQQDGHRNLAADGIAVWPLYLLCRLLLLCGEFGLIRGRWLRMTQVASAAVSVLFAAFAFFCAYAWQHPVSREDPPEQ